MAGCCDHGCELDVLRERQGATLRIVLAINGIMFVIMVIAALYANSTALLSDSLDNLGDAITYGLSLYAIALGARAKAKVALFKGLLIFLASLLIFGQIAYKILHPSVPIYETMGAFSLIGLIANGLCLFLLWRHRNEDINMSSVWECSRNDIASNLAVFVAAAGVWAVGAGWPDMLVAGCLLLIFLRSAFRVIRAARQELLVSPAT